MPELRDYQEDILRRVEAALDAFAGARVMMQLPTGGGKTVIAGELLKRRLTNGRKAVWLTHRKELANQTCGMLADAHVSAMTDVLWTPGTDAPAMSGGVVVLMAQTVGRRTAKMDIWNRYASDDLMVIDEAHHAAAEGWERAMKQWPGQVVGMTATPWRLSEKEGFDHLFSELTCGPQVADLQADGWLCDASIRIPPQDQRILGGAVDRTGEYTTGGIEEANSKRVMTAGALSFWQAHASDRQTIVYAVSVDHAHNLEKVFRDSGVPTEVILGDTDIGERNRAIAAFRDGSLKVLVNVIVATEGFDLPDASCVVITRPTLSLALFMQMMGRGLRPKNDGGNCLILDLAANSLTHGQPEEHREWSLKPRRLQSLGVSPHRRCPECGTEIHPALQNCPKCGTSLGKECNRCGKWRASKRWDFEDYCGDAHELVCDHCHIDAHIRAHLPVTPPLDELADLVDEDDNDMQSQGDIEIDEELAGRLSLLLRELLESERQSVIGAKANREYELLQSIQSHELAIGDDNALDIAFIEYVGELPEGQRPQNEPQKYRMFVDWENSLRKKLDGWRNELAGLRQQPVDEQLIFRNARDKIMHLLSLEARGMELLPAKHNAPSDTLPDSDDGWILISSSIPETRYNGLRPKRLRTPDRQEIQISSWVHLLVEVAEWLTYAGRLPTKSVPTRAGRRYVLNSVPENPSGTKFRRIKKLSNGLYLETNLNAKELLDRAALLIEVSDASGQFWMQLL